VGDIGTVLRSSNGRWALSETPTREDLLAIAGVAPNDLWVAGTGGVMLHFDGSVWATRPAGSTDWVSLHVQSANRVFALDSQGAVALNQNDTSFVRITSPLVFRHLTGVGADVFAATVSGAYRLSGTSWVALDAGFSASEQVLDLEALGPSLALLSSGGLRSGPPTGDFGPVRSTPDASFVFGNAGELWFGAPAGLWRATDAGAQFFAMPSPTSTALAVGNQAWVAGQHGYVAVTFDGGLRSGYFSATTLSAPGDELAQLDVTTLSAWRNGVAGGTSAEGFDAGASWIVRETLGPGLWELRHCFPMFDLAENQPFKRMIVRDDGRAFAVFGSNHVGTFLLDATSCSYGSTVYGVSHLAGTSDFSTLLWAGGDALLTQANALPSTNLPTPWGSGEARVVRGLGARFFVGTSLASVYVLDPRDAGWTALDAGTRSPPVAIEAAPNGELWVLGKHGDLTRLRSDLVPLGSSAELGANLRTATFSGGALTAFDENGEVYQYAIDGGLTRSATPARFLYASTSSDAGLWVGGRSGVLLRQQ
jgi:hypothetical protein